MRAPRPPGSRPHTRQPSRDDNRRHRAGSSPHNRPLSLAPRVIDCSMARPSSEARQRQVAGAAPGPSFAPDHAKCALRPFAALGPHRALRSLTESARVRGAMDDTDHPDLDDVELALALAE